MNLSDSSPQILFPPMGIAHISRDIADLVRHRVDGVQRLEIMTASQPNGPPHLGTLCLFMCAFAVGRHLAERLDLPAELILDVLDNGPALKRAEAGVTWQLSLADTYEGGLSRAERNLAPFIDILERLSAYSGLPYRLRRYGEFQADPSFRRILLEVLRRHDALLPILSPSERRLRVRLRCPVCHWVEKDATATRWRLDGDGAALLSGRCLEHGAYQLQVRRDRGGFVDCNTPLRSVVKAAMLVERERAAPVLTISVDGADWSGVWFSRVVVEGLGRLGYSAAKAPSQFFAPLIVDWSGAKFSKSLYVRDDAYRYLPDGLADYDAFLRIHGQAGFDRLWEEATGWAAEPARLFRSYSIDYIARLLGDIPTPERHDG